MIRVEYRSSSGRTNEKRRQRRTPRARKNKIRMPWTYSRGAKKKEETKLLLPSPGEVKSEHHLATQSLQRTKRKHQKFQQA